MSNFYNFNNVNRCPICGGDSTICRCASKMVVNSPSSYVKDIRRDKYSLRVTAIDESNNVDVWYSSPITNIDEVGDNLVVTMITGDVHTIPLYKGISPELLSQILSGYVSNSELEIFRAEMKSYIDKYFVKNSDLQLMLEQLKCSCKSGCSTCDDELLK